MAADRFFGCQAQVGFLETQINESVQFCGIEGRYGNFVAT
jgi:hypothetical protein